MPSGSPMPLPRLRQQALAAHRGEDGAEHVHAAGGVEHAPARLADHRPGERVRHPVRARHPSAVGRPGGPLEAGLHGDEVGERDPRHPRIGLGRDEPRRDLAQGGVEAGKLAPVERRPGEGGDDALRHRLHVDRPVERRPAEGLGEDGLAAVDDDQRMQPVEAAGGVGGGGPRSRRAPPRQGLRGARPRDGEGPKAARKALRPRLRFPHMPGNLAPIAAAGRRRARISPPVGLPACGLGGPMPTSTAGPPQGAAP